MARTKYIMEDQVKKALTRLFCDARQLNAILEQPNHDKLQMDEDILDDYLLVLEYILLTTLSAEEEQKIYEN